MKHLLKASKDYLHGNLPALKAEVVLGFMMSLFDVTTHTFMEVWCSPICTSIFFTQCEFTPPSTFLQKMKQAMFGLKTHQQEQEVLQEALLVRERNHFHLKFTVQYAGGYLKSAIQQVCFVYVSSS
jgi:hypothetical protein